MAIRNSNGYEQLSSENTSTTPLGSSETFTGGWERDNTPDVGVSCHTDTAGTLFFDFSNDGGANYTTFPVGGFSVAAGIHEFHTAVKLPRYFRVRFTNGADAQTYLRLYTYYGHFRQGNLPVGAGIGADADAIIVRSIDPSVDMAMGRIGGMVAGTKFGRNPDIDTTSAPEDVWAGGGEYTGHPDSFTPETVDVYSSSANDTSAGTGARTVEIYGLKSSTSEEYEAETITLNGTTAVTSSDTWWRVNRVIVKTAGSGGENAGEITVESTTTSANVFAKIPAGLNQTQIAAFTVPANRTMLLKRMRVALTRANGAAGSAFITFRVREPGGVFASRRAMDIQTGSGVQFTSFAGDLIAAGSDVKLRVESVSDNNSVCDAAIEYILIE